MNKFKVSKTVLITIGASIWAFAAFRVLQLGVIDIENNSIHKIADYLIGILGAIPFFLLVFLKVSRKYIKRIVNLPGNRASVFSFMSLKGYLMMSLMITLGILSKQFDIIPKVYKGVFYISLGLSLFSSSIYYIYNGLPSNLNKI